MKAIYKDEREAITTTLENAAIAFEASPDHTWTGTEAAAALRRAAQTALAVHEERTTE